MRSHCIGNPSGPNARMGLGNAWELCQVMTKHILNGKPRLNLKRIQEAQVRTCCRTEEYKKHKFERLVAHVSQTDAFALYWESERLYCSKGTRDRIGGIQESQVRSCCRTSESNGCVHVVFGNPKGSNARMGLVIAWEMRSHFIRNPSGSNARMGFVNTWEGVKQMRSRCIGNPSGPNARMGLVIAWELCQVMTKHILKGKPLLNLKRIQEAQVRTCCRTSESNRCIRVLWGIRVGLMLKWDS
ncbi:uncharacterized protein G2W53_045014 [Senna tora]|uniref:Uncharacterized protein n=1 Tax=Senna tora TaxID=362788 RepID=A0A834SE08_9FABA|nr:uncharacterized protein G2W53_045014 [Senna tora]